MSSSNNVAWLILVVGLLIWVAKLILQIKTLENKIMHWDFRLGRLLDYLNEIEIFNHPECDIHHARDFEQTSFYN